MKLQHRHIIGIGLLYVFLLGFASCANESFDLPCGEAEENSIYLTFHTAVAGVFTRANETPDDARINQLLVVIVSENSAPEEGNALEGETGNANEAGKRWGVEHSRLVKGVSGIGVPLTDEYFQGESRLQEKNLPVGELRRADRWPGGKNRLKQRLFYSGNFPCCSR